MELFLNVAYSVEKHFHAPNGTHVCKQRSRGAVNPPPLPVARVLAVKTTGAFSSFRMILSHFPSQHKARGSTQNRQLQQDHKTSAIFFIGNTKKASSSSNGGLMRNLLSFYPHLLLLTPYEY